MIRALWKPAAVDPLAGLSQPVVRPFMRDHSAAFARELHHAEFALRLHRSFHRHSGVVPNLIRWGHVRVVMDDADQLHVRPEQTAGSGERPS